MTSDDIVPDGDPALNAMENERLQAENKRLQSEVAEHKARIEDDRAIIAKLFVDCDRLRQDKMRLRAALELFAEHGNWSIVSDEDWTGEGNWYWDPTRKSITGHPWELARRALSPESEGQHE